jgi:predicted HicB family RNase H-like nuclease
VSRPRKPGPGRQKPEQLKKSPRKSLPEELARDAVAYEKAAPDRVEMTFRVRLRRPVAEALTAWAVREETNLVSLVAEILEAAVTKGKT